MALNLDKIEEQQRLLTPSKQLSIGKPQSREKELDRSLNYHENTSKKQEATMSRRSKGDTESSNQRRCLGQTTAGDKNIISKVHRGAKVRE